MEIDEFLDKVERGEAIEPEKPKTEIDLLAEKMNERGADKIAVSDKIISSLKEHAEKLKKDWSLAESKVSRIKELLLEMRNSLSKEDVIPAKKAHSEIMELFELIPPDFKEEKEMVKKDICSMEASLLQRSIEFDRKDYDRKKRIILMSMAQAKKLVQEKKVEAAINEYRRCQDVYHSLPEGFSIEKTELYERIVELYKDIIIAAQISSLENRLELQ